MMPTRNTNDILMEIKTDTIHTKIESTVYPFVNKVAIITGSSQGIGKSTALLLAESGWTVWATTRNVITCDLKHKNIRLLEVKLDCAKSIDCAVQHVLNKEGHIDALINNAGHMLIGSCENTSVEEIKSLFEVNVMAPIRLAQSILPSMRAQNYGRIINLGSAAAIQPLPGLGAFSASKAALHSFFQAMAGELLYWNIKITSLEVGSVNTPWIDNCRLFEKGDVAQYNRLCESLTDRLNRKNLIADNPANIAEEIVALLQSESPPLRKAAGDAMGCFMARQLIDVNEELYIQQQRTFLLS